MFRLHFISPVFSPIKPEEMSECSFKKKYLLRSDPQLKSTQNSHTQETQKRVDVVAAIVKTVISKMLCLTL